MSKNITWIVIFVAIVAAALFLLSGLNQQTTQSPNTAPPGSVPVGSPQAVQQPPVTGSDNPDAIAGNILGSSTIAPTPAETDPTLTAPDSDITSGFDQAADTSNF